MGQNVAMRFLIAVIDQENGPADGNEMAAIDAFNDGMQAKGQLLLACGIAGPSESLLIDNRADAGLVENASIFSADEHMSGFWLVNAADADEARALALAGSKACNRRVELRPILGG